MAEEVHFKKRFCSDCGRWLPATQFYYNSYRQRYEWVCKECFKKRIYKNKEARRKAFRKWYYKIKQDRKLWYKYINKKRIERYKRKAKQVKIADKKLKGVLEYLLKGVI